MPQLLLEQCITALSSLLAPFPPLCQIHLPSTGPRLDHAQNQLPQPAGISLQPRQAGSWHCPSPSISSGCSHTTPWLLPRKQPRGYKRTTLQCRARSSSGLSPQAICRSSSPTGPPPRRPSCRTARARKGPKGGDLPSQVTPIRSLPGGLARTQGPRGGNPSSLEGRARGRRRVGRMVGKPRLSLEATGYLPALVVATRKPLSGTS